MNDPEPSVPRRAEETDAITRTILLGLSRTNAAVALDLPLFRTPDVGLPELKFLAELNRYGRMSEREIGVIFGAAPEELEAVTTSLVKRGWVQRNARSGERRAAESGERRKWAASDDGIQWYSVTSKGKDAFLALWDTESPALVEVVSRLTRDEQRTLGTLINRLAQELGRQTSRR